MPYKSKKKKSNTSNNSNSTSNMSNSSIRNSLKRRSKSVNSRRRNTSKRRQKSVNSRSKKYDCKHWFRISDNNKKVDCLLKDGREPDTTLKQLIGSAQDYRRRIVERFLEDDYALSYLENKPKKDISSLLGFFMVLQGGEYGPSYGLPSQKWLNVCINAKKRNN